MKKLTAVLLDLLPTAEAAARDEIKAIPSKRPLQSDCVLAYDLGESNVVSRDVLQRYREAAQFVRGEKKAGSWKKRSHVTFFFTARLSAPLQPVSVLQAHDRSRAGCRTC
jgi:hypothetical protein